MEFQDLISQLVSRFADTISDADDDKKEMIDKFRQYLETELNELQANPVIGSSNFLMKMGLRSKARNVIKLKLNAKKRLLNVRDENLEKLRNLSLKLFELAKKTLLKGDRLSPSMKLDDISHITVDLCKFRDSVKDYNLEEAHKECSRAGFDLNLIYVPGATMASNRIIAWFNQLPPETKENIHQNRVKCMEKYGDEVEKSNTKTPEEREKDIMENIRKYRAKLREVERQR